MKRGFSRSLAGSLSLALLCFGCGQGGSRLTTANYDQITKGMNKAQVEKILGPPARMDEKQILAFENGATRWDPLVTCYYEDGQTSVTITFRNDQVDKKESNLGREP